MKFNISVHSHLTESEVAQVKLIIRAATLIDDLAPLSEHVLIHLQHGGDTADEHIIAWDSDRNAIGYLHLDQTDEVAGPVVEVVVHPEFRGQKIGTALVQYAMERLHDSRLRLWAHGELGSAYALARKLGFSKTRELWQMRRSLYAELPKLDIPTNILIRSFRPGFDEHTWLELNSKVFEKHPEQGRLDERGLNIRMKENWFKAEGFLLAQNNANELVGYNWTKIHGGSRTLDGHHGHPDIGEIYVIGVAPTLRGSGLGKALAVAGLEYLRDQGLAAAMLYVDRDNESAIKLYESIGFAHWDTDVMFQAKLI